MDGDGFLRASRVAIWGLGLMGGSLAMALKGHCAAIYGIDADPGILDLALAWGVIERGSSAAQELLPEADLVILATPVRVILSHLAQLDHYHPGQAVVMDLGSTKQAVTAAMAALPDRFDPLGGHPMCGKEKASLRYAEAALFNQAPFALTALPRTGEKARALGEALVRAVGARPIWIDAGQHDRWVAASSHLPYLVASALARCTPEEVAPLVGSGFRSTARLAGSSPRMMLDILATNTDPIRLALAKFRQELDRYDRLLEEMDPDQITAVMEEGVGRYTRLCG